jgi:hypothetical protein
MAVGTNPNTGMGLLSGGADELIRSIKQSKNRLI